MVVFSTISALVTSTAGITRAIASASAYVSFGENFLTSRSGWSCTGTGPSFCSTSGVIITLLEPSRRSCSRISCSAPLPMASIAMTDATPKRMPNDVRPARSLLCPTASAAVRALNATCVAISRACSMRSAIRPRRRRQRHTLGGVTRRRCDRLQPGNELYFQSCFIRRRHEQHLVTLLETALDDDLVVIHHARLDLLLDDVAAAALVDERKATIVRDRLERHRENVINRRSLDGIRGGHAWPQRRIGLR